MALTRHDGDTAKLRRREIIEKHAVRTALGKVAVCHRCARRGAAPKVVYPSRGAAKMAANEMVGAPDGPVVIYVQKCMGDFAGGWHHTQKKACGRDSQARTVRRTQDHSRMARRHVVAHNTHTEENS